MSAASSLIFADVEKWEEEEDELPTWDDRTDNRFDAEDRLNSLKLEREVILICRMPC